MKRQQKTAECIKLLLFSKPCHGRKWALMKAISSSISVVPLFSYLQPYFSVYVITLPLSSFCVKVGSRPLPLILHGMRLRLRASILFILYLNSCCILLFYCLSTLILISTTLHPNQGWQVRLQSGSDWTPNWTNPGLFLDEPNVLKSDLKKSRICPIWVQSDPL